MEKYHTTRRIASTLLFLVLLSLTATAQDFKLFYAKNVTDATNFRNLSELDKQLHWREVSNGSIDGNLDDVMQVKNMLASTRMKGLDDQRLFWKMRDEMLLCFRIDDPSNAGGTFRVEVNYGPNGNGKDIKKTLTTRKYFFANMPLASDSIAINVWRVKDPEQRINFRYWVYDWDDENVYIFQLDQKRQSTGDTYKMEYVTSYMDAEGERHSQANTLELKETKFQSFYVPEGHSLTDVYFLTGNSQEGDVKLRLDMEDIHAGIDIDNQLEVPSLLPTFKLSKHENRELMNFNWVGTGLFEKYDTLFIKLFNEKGKTISKARMNVHRVDDDGNLVADNTLQYLGYDANSKYYKVLTYGHPAYVEILADGYLPLVYRYKGAADRTSHIVSSDLCSAKITLQSGNVSDSEIAISDQYFRFLYDEAVAVNRTNASGESVSYAVVSVKEFNISGNIPSDNVSFMDNAGNDYPKLLNNSPIEKMAEFEIVFSAPAGGGNPQARMIVTELKSKKTHEAEVAETQVVSAAAFTNFTRDYYFIRYDMSKALPYNEQCSLALTTPNASYNKFPTFVNVYKNNEEEKKKGDEKAKEILSPPDGRKATADFNGAFDLGIQIPFDVKGTFGNLTIKSGTNIDFLKQTFNMYINATYGRNFKKSKGGQGGQGGQGGEGGEGQGGEGEGQVQPEPQPEPVDKLKQAQANARELQNWRYMSLYKEGEGSKKKEGSFSMAEPSYKYEDWVLQEMESMFQVQSKHVGKYFQGGGKLMFKMPLFYVLPDVTDIQLAEASGFFQIGWGMFFNFEPQNEKLKKIFDAVREKMKCKIDLGAQFDVNLKAELGVKSYGKRDQYEWDAEDKGVYFNIILTGLIAAWADFKTPQFPFLSVDLGLRAGAKAQAAFGLMKSFGDYPLCLGTRIMGVGGVEAHLNLRSCILQINTCWGFRAGGQFMYPDNNTNPFHKKFPYWLPDNTSKGIIGNQFRTLALPEANSLGRPLVNNLYFDANPHFFDGRHIVYNDLGTPKDYNDDHVVMASLGDEDTVTDSETLSIPGTFAGQHMRSKRGAAEVVAYQQVTKAIDNAAVNDETVSALDNEMLASSRIMAAFRQSDGTWKQTVAAPVDGFTNKEPVVTIQEDGKAAVVYQHGKLKAIDETVSVDSVWNQRFEGELQLRTYDPASGWSEPKSLWGYSDISWPLKYDLIMRNDTVLVGTMLEEPSNPMIGNFAGKYTRYGWTTTKKDQVLYTHEDLRCVDFFMNRVGEHAVVALLYERPDTTREVYIKTVNMDGTDDGLAGCDLGVGRSMPGKVKIICDRSDNDTDDFAVLWTEESSTAYDAENGNKSLKDYYTVINATRVHLSEAPRMTYPLTVGAERDSLQLSGFDGYLDDASIKVVYALAHPVTGTSVVMYNEKEFTNSFESDVTYSREALLGSSTLPVNVYIRNTGTSAIQGATVTINGDAMVIPDVHVLPLHEEKYVVQYPIPSNFDGYMQSTVEVEYANVFKARQQTGRRAAPRNLLRQRRAMARERVATGEIDFNVVSRHVENGVNTFVVEVTDYSSRGLLPGTAVQVGAYVHPSAMETVTAEAKTIVHAEDFTRIGGVRKAYAELTVSGITEAIDGYIAAHIVDLNYTDVTESEDAEAGRIDNSSPIASAAYVLFHPTGETTNIYAPVKNLAKEHRIGVTIQDGGILLSNLEPNEDIRLFNAAGLTVYMDHAATTTHFVPLKHHGVYIISAGNEVFKFSY